VLHIDVGRRLDQFAECEQILARRAAAVVAKWEGELDDIPEGGPDAPQVATA
jgi:hypothetical protein